MNNAVFALIYERIWRPLSFFLVSGRTMRTDRSEAVRALRLNRARRILDIACGPGNFTLHLSTHAPDAHAVGIDFSIPMLRQARTGNAGPGVSYVRGDARRLPFPDGSFDAICCFGALYLIPDPMVAAQEMLRVLAPGGRIAISTSYRYRNRFGRTVCAALGGAMGVRFFEVDVFPKLFAEAGLVDVEQEVHGLLQYLSATRPE